MGNGPLTTRVFTSPTHTFGRRGRTFSPTTSTLIAGRSEAVLVDAQFINDDVAALGDLIENTGKTLTAIYVTHGHADHYFGLGQLMRRFPEARPLAAKTVADHIGHDLDNAVRDWTAMFGDTVTLPTALPAPLDNDVIDLEGHELRVVEVGQGDIASSTVLHIPSIDTVIAGDVAYNEIHPMLSFTGPEGWAAWIASLDRIEDLQPRMVVAGHKKPEADDRDVQSIVQGTRAYIHDFRDSVAAVSTADELVERMTELYPRHGNLTTLEVSARAAFARQP